MLTEMEVERAVVAEEACAEVMAKFAERLDVESVTHEALKEMSAEALAVVRTGVRPGPRYARQTLQWSV